MADTLLDLMREVGLEPSAVQTAIAPARPPLHPQRAPFGVRPMPRQMRRPEVRAADARLAPAERARAYNQVQRTQTPALRGERLPPSNQFAEAGEMAAEFTGVPQAYRSGEALHERRYRDAAMEGGSSLLALAGWGLPGARGPRAGTPRVASRAPRGLDVESSLPPERVNDLDRWRRDRAAMLPDLVRRQRTIDGSYGDGTPDNFVTMNQLIEVGSDPAVAHLLPEALDDYLGAFGVNRENAHLPLLGTPEIGADPMVTRAPPGRGARMPPSRAMPNEDRYLFGRPPPPRPTTDAVQPNDLGPAVRRQFTGPRGQEYEVVISPDNRAGVAAVSFARVRTDGFAARHRPHNDLTPGEARAVYRDVARIVREDAAQHNRAAYGGQGYTDRQTGLYAALSDDALPGYVREPNDRAIILRRSEAPRPTPSDATRGGARPTSDGARPRPPPDLNKSYRRPKPPNGGFLLPRRTR